MISLPAPRALVAALLPAAVLLLAAGCAGPGDLGQAQRQLQAGQLQRACQSFEHLAGSLSSREARLEALRGYVDCQARSGQLPQAARWLTDQPSPYRLYGEALLEVAASPARLPRAVAQLEQVARLWPDLGEAPYRAGLLLLADEQPAAALPLLERGCRLTVTAACKVALAHALLDLGRAEEALRTVAEVPGLSPRPADLARGRALVQRVARRAAEVPAEAAARLQQARQLAEARGSEAIRVLEALLLDHPRLAPAHTLLGLTHLRLGNAAEAVVALRQAAELNPLDAVNPLFLGVIYQGRGRAEEAIAKLRLALRLDPFLAGAAHRLGELLVKRGSAREAAELLEQAAAVDGGSPVSLRLAGRAHLAAGALERAEACFRRLQRSEPRDYEINLRLGQILIERQRRGGDPALLQEAERHLELAAEARPADPEVEQLRLRLRPSP